MYLKNVMSKKNRKQNIFCMCLECHRLKDQDPDPDPFVSGTDPRIRIRTKMSRIRNTAQRKLFQQFSCRTDTAYVQLRKSLDISSIRGRGKPFMVTLNICPEAFCRKRWMGRWDNASPFSHTLFTGITLPYLLGVSSMTVDVS